LGARYRLADHRRPEETRIAEIVDLYPVDIVALADLLGDPKEIVAHLLLLEIQSRPPVPRVSAGILLFVARLTHQELRIVSLPL